MARRDAAPPKEPTPKRACCLVSEILEEAGLDRRKAREMRRQILHGVVLFCQWQLERIAEAEAAESPSRPPSRKARRVPVQ